MGPTLPMISIVVPALLSVAFYRKVVLPPRTWAEGTGGNLIGEARIKTKQDAHDFAQRAVQEGYALWDEPSSDWEVMHRDDGADGSNDLLVESRRITEGPFVQSDALLTRSKGTVIGADPDEVYDFFISPEGMQLLDPSMDPNEVAKYIERFDWKGAGKDARLDVHESFNPMPPGVADRYHVVLNGYRTKERFFFCKSIVHDSRPGSSAYYDGSSDADAITSAADPRVRAVNTFYFHIAPTPDGRGSVVRMVNFADFRMMGTTFNWLTSKLFFPGVYQRLEEKFGKTKA